MVQTAQQPDTRPVHRGALIHEGEGWSLRLASDEDGEALCGLLEEVSFGSPTPIFECRDPDFFALRRLQTLKSGDPPMVFVVHDDEGVLQGGFSVAVQAARMGSQRLAVGAIGDLRFRPDFRGGRVFPTALRHGLQHVRNWHGAEVFRTATLEHDYRALRAFIHRDERRFEQPMAQVIVRMRLALVPFGARGLPTPKRHVQQASDVDHDELVAFLVQHEATRRFGTVVTGPQLAHRIAAWPGFDLENFFVVRARGGRIVGCAAPWDPGPMRRIRLATPSGAERWKRWRQNMGASVRGYRPVPQPTEEIRPFFLTHLAVHDDEPATFRDLLAGIMHLVDDGAHDGAVMAVTLGMGLDRGLSTITSYSLPLSVMAITPAGTVWNNVDFRAQKASLEPLFL